MQLSLFLERTNQGKKLLFVQAWEVRTAWNGQCLAVGWVNLPHLPKIKPFSS